MRVDRQIDKQKDWLITILRIRTYRELGK